MAATVKIYQYGGPEEFVFEESEPVEPQKEEVLLRHKAIGLNFIDIYHRKGLYPLSSLPAVIGMEGSGIVEMVGQGVKEFSPGDRVGYAGATPGAYSTYRTIAADRLVPLPDSLSYQSAAAIMLKGMTVRYLLFGCYSVSKGDIVLIHAAAGGVGTIFCQWAAYLGALVIGTVGTSEKAEIAKKNGCHYPIIYLKENFVDRVMEITSDRGVDVVYDSVGQTTFEKSLDCLRPLGTMVSFGQSSGPVAPFDLAVLGAKGSLFLTRPSLITYTAKREDLLAHARDLFDVVQSEVVKVPVPKTYFLSQVAKAHHDLESRSTSGSAILLPD